MAARLLAGLIGLGLLLGGPAWAQSEAEVSVSAQATPSEVGTAGTITFEIEVRGAPLSAIQTPNPPPTTNLVLQESTPTTQREVSFDSGRLTRRVTLRWRYQPMQVGIGRIRPTTIRVRGREYTTNEIRVRVVPHSQRSGRSDPDGAEPRSSSASPDARGSTGLRPRDLFIRATASTETAYQNEQVTAEYRLFFRPGVRLRQSRMAEAWDAPGFWREELDVASRPTPRTRTAYGQTYETIVLKRVALFPTRTGTLRVDPLRIETEAQPHSRRGRGRRPPSRRRYEPVTLSSEALSVAAEPLPPGEPPAFDGAVGTFTLDTTLDDDSVKAGDAVALTARIEGVGNLATVSPPAVDPPSDFEAYEPDVQTDIDRSGERVRGTKTFTYTLVPRSNGGYTLPPVTFAYFDPKTETYKTQRSEPITLHVTGDAPPQSVGRTGEGLPVGDIAGPIDDDVRWVRADRRPLYRQPWAYAMLLVPFVLAGGGIAYRQYAAGKAVAAPDSSDGLDTAQRHLQDAHRHLREEETQTFHQTIERALLTFLSARLGLPEASTGKRREVIERRLTRHDVSDPERQALHDLLDACDRAQFTPAEPSHEAMAATLDQAQTLLLRLDDAVPDPSAPESA